MDSLDTSKATSCLSNDEEKVSATVQEETSRITASKRDCFLSTYRRQSFDLPDSIMYYIAMNPATSKFYQSLIKTCKYFFLKNSIITISDAYWENKQWRGDVYGRHNIIDMTKLCSKLWIEGRFDIFNYTPDVQNIVSTIIPMLYRFDAKELTFINQIMSLNEFACISSSAINIELFGTIIKDENGDVAALEKLVEIVAKVKRFTFFRQSDSALTNITSKTAKKLFENPDFSRLEHFCMDHIPQAFDIDVFYEYMKTNTTTKFDLHFDDTISDAYKARLNAIVDEILGTEILDYKPPFIHFTGIDRAKCYKLYSLFCGRR